MTTRTISVLAPLVLLAACNQSDQATPITMNAQLEDGNVATAGMDKDGRVRIDTPLFKADVQIPKVAIDAANMDLDGMKMFPGAKIEGMDIQGQQGSNGGIRLRFDAPTGVEAVRGWFIEEAKRAGFDVRVDGGALVGSTTDGSPMRLEFTDGGGGHTKGVIAISAKP